ncbi:MAG TPA: hypothetical protein VFJ47_13055 [Terriglobales bacterium]|nr:hypothetical protein [Terriglobales bacterium]
MSPAATGSASEEAASGSPRNSPQPSVSAWTRPLFPSLADVIFAALLLSLSFGVLPQRLLGDADTGWHIRDGQNIVNTRTIPRTDDFSSTMRGQRWYAWEWLYDAVLGLVYNSADLNGVVFLSAFLIALTFTLLFRLQLAGGTNLPVAIFFLLLSVSASTIHFLARPHLVTWLFTLLWFQILDSTETSNSANLPRTVYWLPILMVFWVNLHGGLIMGFILLGIYLLAAVVEALASSDLPTRTRAGNRARRLAVISVLCLCASLVNPYGYKLHAHVYGYLSNRFLMNHIEEFQSPNFHDLAPRCFVVLLLLAFFTLGVSSRRARLSHLLLILFAISSALYAARNVPIASMLVTLTIAPLLSAWISDSADRAELSVRLRTMASRLRSFSDRMAGMESRQRAHLWPALVVLFSLGVCQHQGRLGDRPLMNAQFDGKRFPVAATDLLRARHIQEPIFSLDSWGGYVIYRLYPQTRVVVDDRHDLYGEQFLKKYLKVIHVEPDWEKVLDDWKVNWVLLPANSALSTTLKQTSNWKIVHDDGVGIVFQREGVR